MVEVNKIMLNSITLIMRISRVGSVLFLKETRTDDKKEGGKAFEKKENNI